MTSTVETQEFGSITSGPPVRSSSLWTPAQNNLQASNGDPNVYGNATIMVAGTVYVMRVEIPFPMIVSNLWIAINVAGSALGSGAGVTVASLWNSAGTKMADTADQSAAWAGAGAKPMAITPQTLSGGAAYYVSFFCGSGTTMPTPNRGVGQNVVNANLTGPNLRCSVAATGLGTVPASLTLANLTGTGALMYWVGIS